MVRIYLAVVGIAYLFLGIWCSVAPGQTSKSVGFDLRPGSGQSEYLVVYGGLELAIGLFLIWPIFGASDPSAALRFCLILHGCLVLFRTMSFFLFSEVHTTTYVLAGVEWAIFLWGVAVSFRHR
jgi:hypothetical protein